LAVPRNEARLTGGRRSPLGGVHEGIRCSLDVRSEPRERSCLALRIANNVCHEKLRRHDGHDVSSDGSLDRALGNALDESEQVVYRRILKAALDRLPAERREVVLLVAAMGLSYKEAAEALGVPIGTVRSRFYRARRQLRGWLRDERKVSDGHSVA